MPQKAPAKTKPEIVASKVVAQSRLFKVEQLDLKFSNGVKRSYERMKGSGRGAVMVIACANEDEFYLVREYCAGTHDYQLGFPKGLIDPGETVLEAANRELQEEIGFKAERFVELKTLALAPSYFNATMHLVLAFELSASLLEGDEPEPLELESWRWSQLQELLAQDDFSEARSVAALYLARAYLDAHQDAFKSVT